MEDKGRFKETERLLSPMNGLPVLLALLALGVVAIAVIAIAAGNGSFSDHMGLRIAGIITGCFYWCVIFPIGCAGLKIIHPNEAAVYVLFGTYYGTIAKAGFFFIHPFCAMFNPTTAPSLQEVAAGVTAVAVSAAGHTAVSGKQAQTNIGRKKVSLRAATLSNDKQKINDREGNPIEIGVVVIWRVVNPTRAVFEVDNYNAYVSIQCDAAIRQVARQYPYDMSEDGDEKSLRGSSVEVAQELKRELQARVDIAGVEILEARIAHLAYAQEIAAAMLQRQQADAVIAARQKIVEGAVGMVEMALNRLAENGTVTLDEERKAAMVSNLLVVLCGNRDAQPIVNSGSLY